MENNELKGLIEQIAGDVWPVSEYDPLNDAFITYRQGQKDGFIDALTLLAPFIQTQELYILRQCDKCNGRGGFSPSQNQYYECDKCRGEGEYPVEVNAAHPYEQLLESLKKQK